jgi:putative transposase
LRPKVDAQGRLVGLQWGAGFVIPIAEPARAGRRGREQQGELAEIRALIAAGKVLRTRIVRTVIDGRDTYRMQMVMDGPAPRRHPVGGSGVVRPRTQHDRCGSATQRRHLDRVCTAAR